MHVVKFCKPKKMRFPSFYFVHETWDLDLKLILFYCKFHVYNHIVHGRMPFSIIIDCHMT